jgi:hypothetical protein
MTELNTKRYQLRLTKPFAWYDIGRSEMWREWRAGQDVVDAADVALLESIEGAPIERVELPANPGPGPFRR